MIITKELNIKEIPTLLVEKQAHENLALPTIIFFHGFESAKENNLTLAYLLAKEDFRVILPEARYHGERCESLTKEELAVSFWEIVKNNVVELNQIKEELDAKKLILNEKIGIAGTSMGGITTAASLRKYNWIKTAVSLMGSPNLPLFAEQLIDEYNKMAKKPIDKVEREAVVNDLYDYDLFSQEDKLNNRPIMFWHGLEDKIVPIKHTKQFIEKLNKPQYSNEIKFLEEANRGHHLSRFAILETVKWFEKHL